MKRGKIKTNPSKNPTLPVTFPVSTTVEIDSTIVWSRANPYGIQEGPPSEVDPLGGAWLAGHVNDVLPIKPPDTLVGSLVIGSSSGGVWVVYPPESGDLPPAAPLSDDWDVPGVTCLCQGPDGPQHIYAGTCDVVNGNLSGYVYETVVANGVHSIESWRPVRNVWPRNRDFVCVYRLAVVAGNPNRIVAATQIGVWWSNVPAPGGFYYWKPVLRLSDGTPFPQGAYSGVALGPNGSVVVAAYGVNVANKVYGIFYGDWSTGTLVMTRAQMPPSDPKSFITFEEGMYRTSVSSCSVNPSEMSAVSADAVDAVYVLLRSHDGGKTWFKPYDPTGTNPNAMPTVFSRSDKSVAGSLWASVGVQGWYNNCIAVSHADKSGNTVAFGWQSGTFLSSDGGRTWEFFDWAHPKGSGLHSDIHGLYFDPADKSGETFYICSDGGVAVTRDGGASFDTSPNKYLAQLELYGTTGARDFYGTLSLLGPLVAAGSQDNGNLYCVAEGSYDTGVGVPSKAPSPWIQFSGCDGGLVTFLRTGQVLFGGECGGPALNLWERKLRSDFIFDIDPGAELQIRDPGQPDDGKGLAAVVEAVRDEPKIVNARGQTMYAVGGSGLNVYGVFAAQDGTDVHYEHLGSVKSDVLTDQISAVGSFDGSTVFIGTWAGRMFQLSPVQGMRVAGKSLQMSLPASNAQGAVQRIVALSASRAFATYNFGWSGFVIQFDGATWAPSGAGLPGDAFQGLEADDSGNIFADTDHQVFLSRDGGTTWLDCSSGLPKQAHCTDLRFTRDSNGQAFLYLNTFGHSLWRAELFPPVRLKKLSLNPYAVRAGQNSKGTVLLNAPAPAQGAVVTLGSSDPALAAVPASVTVLGGNTSAVFYITTHKRGGSSQTAEIVAALVDIFNTTLTVNP
jgi:hypothetical protein